MVEAIELRESAHALKDNAHKVAIGVESAGVRAASSAETGALRAIGDNLTAFGIASGVTVGLEQWDYLNKRDDLRRKYELELMAQTGKHYNELSNKDLDQLGSRNAVVNDALRRARVKRNIGLVLGVIAMGAAFVASGGVASLVGGALGVSMGTLGGSASVGGATVGATVLSALGSVFSSNAPTALAAVKVIGTGLAAGAAGIATFMATEAAGDEVAGRLFRLKEPTLHKVTKDPSLQSKLSLSSQVNYIEHLQKRVRAGKPNTFISQEQVFKVFVAANPGMAASIKNRYGKDFSELAPEQRVDILRSAGSGINLEQLTSDLNNRQVRAQELAFLVQGESSGVPRRESPRLSTAERAHQRIEQELAEAKQVIGKLKRQIKATDTKLGNVMGAKLDMNRNEQPPSEPPVLNNQEVMGPATQRLISQRKAKGQQQGASVSA